MLRPHRIWLAVALTALVSASTARAADAKYLPSDTEIVVTLNFRQILDSDLVKGQKDAIPQAKSILENLPGYNDAQQYLKTAGFDLFRDLVSITFAMPARKDPEAGLLIVEGKFNANKFHEAADQAIRDHGDVVKVAKQGARKVYEVTGPADGKQVFIAMASKNLILACSSQKEMKAALARVDGTKKSTLKKNVQDLLETTNLKQSFSGVATGNALAKLLEDAPIPNAQAVAPILQAIEGLSGAVTIGKDIQFQLGVGTKDANTAKTFAQQATIFLGLGRMLAAQKAKEDEKLLPLVDVMKTVSATAQGSNLVFRGQVSVENIEKLIKNFNQKNNN